MLTAATRSSDALEGVLHVRAFSESGTSVFELNPTTRPTFPRASRTSTAATARLGARALRHRALVSAMTLAIGIDVGGTKIAAGVVDTGTGAARGALRTGHAARARLGRGARRLRRPGTAAGSRAGGPADRHGRLRADRPRRTRAIGADARVAARRRRGRVRGTRTAVVESDVRAAALAEARFGAGRGVEELLFVIVGTGISCCLVLGGRAYAGARGNAICFGAPPSSRRPAGSPWPRPEDASAPRRCSPTRRSTAWSRRPQPSSGSVSPGSSTRSTRGWS